MCCEHRRFSLELCEVSNKVEKERVGASVHLNNQTSDIAFFLQRFRYSGLLDRERQRAQVPVHEGVGGHATGRPCGGGREGCAGRSDPGEITWDVGTWPMTSVTRTGEYPRVVNTQGQMG